MSKTLTGEMSVEHVRRYAAEREQRQRAKSHPPKSAEPESQSQLLQQANAQIDHLTLTLKRFREELDHCKQLLQEEGHDTRPVVLDESATASGHPAQPGGRGDAAAAGGGITTPESRDAERSETGYWETSAIDARLPEPETVIPPTPYGGRWLSRVVYVCTVVLLGTLAGMGFYDWQTSRLASPDVTTASSARLTD